MMKKIRRSVFVCGLSVILKIKKKYGLDGYHVKIDKKKLDAVSSCGVCQ